MANPTTKVPSTQREYTDYKFYWPISKGNNPYTYQDGQMIGLITSTSGNYTAGYATNMDDSRALIFLGILSQLNFVVNEPGFVDGSSRFRVSRPYRFSMPLASGTATRAADIGKAVYAVDAGHVQIGTAGLSNSNYVGILVDVVGTGQPDALTGTEVWISPTPPPITTNTLAATVTDFTANTITGGQDPLAVAGRAGATSTAGGAITLTGGTSQATAAGGAVTLVGGVGGSTSGAGGAASLVGGAGGGAGTAGGATTIAGGAGVTSGAGGALSLAGGAGGNAGAGGAVTLIGGAGSGAGAAGTMTITGGAGGATNVAGGATALAGGAGGGTGAGGLISLTGGASGTGATGNGGLSRVVGGAALSTNGTGGAAQLTGGVATGTGTGGAVTIAAGASGGASGTAGAVTINAGAAAGGTAAGVTIQSSNAPVAGGGIAAAILCSSTALLGIYFGTGAPTFSAAKGSLYIKTDASTSATRLYIASDAVGTWTAYTSAA